MTDPNRPRELGRTQSAIIPGIHPAGRSSGYILVVASKPKQQGGAEGRQLPSNVAFSSAIGMEEIPNCLMTAHHSLASSLTEVNGEAAGPADVWAIAAVDYHDLPVQQKANLSGLGELGAVKALGYRSPQKITVAPDEYPTNDDWAIIVLAGPIKLYPNHPRLPSQKEAKLVYAHLINLSQDYRATINVSIEGSGYDHNVVPGQFDEVRSPCATGSPCLGLPRHASRTLHKGQCIYSLRLFQVPARILNLCAGVPLNHPNLAGLMYSC
jgi:hypothetical protein